MAWCSAADPLNLTGIVTPGDRIRTASGNRLVYRNGVPLAALEGDMLRTLGDIDPSIAVDVAAAAAFRSSAATSAAWPRSGRTFGPPEGGPYTQKATYVGHIF